MTTTIDENKTEQTAENKLMEVAGYLSLGLSEWKREVAKHNLPKALSRKNEVALQKAQIALDSVIGYVQTARPVGRPGKSVTKTALREGLKNASPEQLAEIAKILGEKTEEISPVSAGVETDDEESMTEAAARLDKEV